VIFGHAPRRLPKSVEIEDVEKFAEFGATGQRQCFVDRQVGGVQAIAKHFVGLDREEAKSGVVRPVEPQAVVAARDFCPKKAFLPQCPLERESGLPQVLRIGFRAQGDALSRIVENIEVIRITETGVGTIDHCPARQMAIGVAVRREHSGHLPLESG
jgi:hypothetical protein